LEDPDIRASFKKETEERFKDHLTQIENGEAEDTSESLWASYKNILSETADQTLGKGKRYPKKPWISSEVLKLAEEKSNLRKKRSSPDQEQRYKELRSEIQRKVRADKAVWLEDQCRQIDEFDRQGKSKKMFDTIKTVKNNNSRITEQACIKDEDGNVLDQREDILERWKDYGAKLFERPEGEVPLTEDRVPSEEQEPPPLLSEVESALKRLSSGKSPGLDGIPAELVKATGPLGIEVLHRLCISIWESCHWPEDWKIQEFVVLFKSGDRKQCSNYRTIALISHTSKILLIIIVDRLKQKLEQEQPEEQAAYRKGRGTRDMLVCLQVLLEKVIAVDQQVFIMFIDYSKAFDSVCHSQLFEAFLEMGFPKHLVALLQSLYVNQRAIIRWNGEHTSEFEIGKGARQGCIVSPHLFVTYTEKVMRDAEASTFGIKVGGTPVSNLRYADDTALIEGSEEAIEILTNNVNDAGKKLNLKLNVKKTKLLVAGKADEKYNIMIDGEDVEQVEKFKYLGSTKTATAKCSDDIKCRIAIAKRRMIELQDLWNDKSLSIQLKVKIVKTLVWSALIYGAEAWTLCKSDENRILAAEMWLWRRLLKISWKEKRTNASVLSELMVKRELLGKIVTLKMGYFGHILRGSGSPLTLQIIEGKVEGKRKRGRQKKKWYDNIREWTGLSYIQAKRLAQDRRAWRGEVKKCAEVVANRQR
jgi:hypothetical protein